MSSYEQWVREISIILNDTVGESIGDVAQEHKIIMLEMFKDQCLPIEGAQWYAEMYIDESLDIEGILIDKMTPKIRVSSKKTKKFKADEHE